MASVELELFLEPFSHGTKIGCLLPIVFASVLKFRDLVCSDRIRVELDLPTLGLEHFVINGDRGLFGHIVVVEAYFLHQAAEILYVERS